MLIEDLYKQVEKLASNQEMNMSNKIKIEFIEGQLKKALEDIEKLKDANREMKYTNGNGQWVYLLCFHNDRVCSSPAYVCQR